MPKTREIVLNEIHIHAQYIDEALSAILHTILFLRAPSVNQATDHSCQLLLPLIYTKCGSIACDKSINASIDLFKKSLYLKDGSLKGEVVLSFFDKQEVKEYMGWVTRNENICFEAWRVQISLLTEGIASTGNTNTTTGTTVTGTTQQHHTIKTPYEQVTEAIMTIIQAVNRASTQMPLLSRYDYEISITPATRRCSDTTTTTSSSM